MATEIIRDKQLMIIGYIERTPTQSIARDKHQMILGYYRPADNYTRDRQFMIVGTGDQLMSLIAKGR